MNAELAYLFRHAVLREVAYSLWLPTDRARLHEFAMSIIENTPGADLGRLAAELADHAFLAQQAPEVTEDKPRLQRLHEAEERFLRLALAQAQKTHHRGEVARFCRRILASRTLSTGDAGEFEQVLASELQANGKLDEAKSHFEHAAKAADTAGLHGLQARCLVGVAINLTRRGLMSEAEQVLNSVLELTTEHQEWSMHSSALNWLAGIYEDTGRVNLCELTFKRAADVAMKVGNDNMFLACLGNLSNFYRTTGRLEESAQTMRTVLAGFEKLQDLRNIGTALNNLGRTSYMLNRLDDAELAYQQALAVIEPIGERFSGAFALGNLADIWIARGKLQQALGALERAISMTEETANWMHAAAFLAKLADLRLLTGERELARETAEESRTAFIHSGASQYIPAYCDIVRLRLAADAATDPEELLARKTVRIEALAPKASWLPVMKQILAGMKKAGSGGLASNLELKLNIAAGDALVSEIAAAISENRPALVYHGYRPAELSAELRAALLQRLSSTKRLALLARLQPGLLAALKNPAA